MFVVNALPKVHPPPAPLKVRPEELGNETPFVVNVLPVVVEENVIAAFEVHTVPASRDMEPAMFRDGPVPVAKVTVPAETVMSRQFRPPVIVTV